MIPVMDFSKTLSIIPIPILKETKYNYFICGCVYRKKDFQLQKFYQAPYAGWTTGITNPFINSWNALSKKLNIDFAPSGPKVVCLSTFESYLSEELSDIVYTDDLSQFVLYTKNFNNLYSTAYKYFAKETPDLFLGAYSYSTCEFPTAGNYTTPFQFICSSIMGNKCVCIESGNNASYRRWGIVVADYNNNTGVAGNFKTVLYSSDAPDAGMYIANTLFMKTDSQFGLFSIGCYNHKLYIYGYNFATSTTTTIKASTDDSLNSSPARRYNKSLGICELEDGTFAIYYTGISAEDNTLIVRRIKVNSTFNGIVEDMTTVTPEGFTFPEYNTALANYSGVIASKVVQKSDGKYLVVFPASPVNFAVSFKMYNSNLELINNIYIFKIDESTGDLTYIETIPIVESQIVGFISDINLNNGFIATKTGVIPFTFDNGVFTKGEEISINWISAYRDEYGRNFIFDEEGKMYVLSSLLPFIIEVKLDVPTTEYSGEDINGNIVLNVYNYKKERIYAKVKLMSLNPTVLIFSDNNSNTVEVYTSTADDTLVPIAIKGPGTILIDKTILSVGG